MKIIKGDRVVVLAGKDKGAEGVVQKAMPETGKVVVEDLVPDTGGLAVLRADHGDVGGVDGHRFVDDAALLIGPGRGLAVSYTHLTLPTKRIV